MEKKLIILILTIMLSATCSTASAIDVLVGGWWNGSLTELQAARSDLQKAIELKEAHSSNISGTVILRSNWFEGNVEELKSAIQQLDNEISSKRKQQLASLTADNSTTRPVQGKTDHHITTPKSTPQPTARPVTRNSSTVFTNAYGTPTTRCAHPGCTNYIASSGDTNCCTIHSRRCANCGKYIDEDGFYCISCIANAITNIKNNK